jgi:NitT/TauT family transport system ATP-binding protein
MKSPVVLSQDSAPGTDEGSNAPLIRLRGVEKRYKGGVAALAGVDLDIAEGEFLSLLGPSGCGKTTLLRIIAGLAKPSAGRVEASAKAGGGGIGFVFQEPTLMPWASVFDNVYLPLQLAGSSRAAAAAAVESAIVRVGLAGFEGTYPRALSGGMKMRVSIARALVTAPRLLLMDEPFASLDAITRARVTQDLLTLVEAEHMTVLLVTHDLEEALALSDVIYLLSHGPRAGISQRYDVPIPRPRDVVTARTHPAFAPLLAALWRDLSREVAGDMAAA